jgi:UDP-N-acetylmuramoylalanine--D-glutamate ligase
MTPVTCFSGREVALFGLGGSGQATAKALADGGARVAAWDDSEVSRDKARGAGIPIVDLARADWNRFAALVLSPGVPLTHPAPHWTAVKAASAGIEIVGDVELFRRERAIRAPGSPFIAITGTNGKSTTTALTAHLMRASGRDTQMGGNIGTAVLLLDPPAPARVHVVECSSFQIDLAPGIDPSVGILLNVTPDHLDRHGTMENYAAVKERLVGGAAVPVVGVDDPWCVAIHGRLAEAGRPVVAVSVERPLADGFFRDGSAVVRAEAGRETGRFELAGIGSLRGAHNAQNAACAIAAASALGLSDDEIRSALASFPGLAHRMEQVAREGRVLFVNDSKATNADAAEKALLAFPAGIHWIIGGIAKEGGIAPLASLFGRVEHAYLIGQASAAFAAALDGKVPYTLCDRLPEAVEAAAAGAARSSADEPVVLLSPACASFDHYPNFEVRGTHFRDLVLARPGAGPLAATASGKA